MGEYAFIFVVLYEDRQAGRGFGSQRTVGVCCGHGVTFAHCARGCRDNSDCMFDSNGNVIWEKSGRLWMKLHDITKQTRLE